MKILLSLYLFGAVITTLFFGAYFYTKARTNYRKVFSVLTLCISIYLFGYIMVCNGGNPHEMIFWNQIQYLGLPFIAALWLLVAFLYTKTIYILKKRTAILLFFIPIITFLIRISNRWHHFFYKAWSVKQVFGYNSLSMEQGLWYYIHIYYTIFCLFLAVIIYYLGFQKYRPGSSRPQYFIFLCASLLPLIGSILNLFVLKKLSIDWAALIMPVSILIVSFGIVRYDFFEIKALARETIFENSTTGMIVLEPGLRVVDYNKAALDFFGMQTIALGNHSIEHLLRDRPGLLEIFKNESTRELSLIVEGTERVFKINSLPLGSPPDQNAWMLKTINEITEEKKVEDRLKTLATIDSLSCLCNRAEFLCLAREELIQTKHNGEPLSFLMMDMDGFKKINDTFGHAAGDAAIRRIGDLIRTGFRKTDITGRLGGEEFAVILKNTAIGEASKVAEQFRETVAKTKIKHGKHEISLTVSIGVVVVTSAAAGLGCSIDSVIKRADQALYRAKAKGRNCVVILS